MDATNPMSDHPSQDREAKLIACAEEICSTKYCDTSQREIEKILRSHDAFPDESEDNLVQVERDSYLAALKAFDEETCDRSQSIKTMMLRGRNALLKLFRDSDAKLKSVNSAISQEGEKSIMPT